MIQTISRTQDTIMVVENGIIKTARADHPKWEDITKTFNCINFNYVGDRFTGPVEELLNLMDLKTAVETYTVGKLSVDALGVTYAGRPLHTIDVERVMAFMRDKLSYRPLANYIERKMKNPSARAIQEMYNFLEHKGMPLTPKGTFLAYKGVTSDFWSINGNKETVVLQGRTDSQGRILNEIGSTIEVERSSVDDDFRQGCSHGLHAGSLAYAKGWGQRVVLVEIDPADVVSVPEDCSCQKLRCCKYTVVAEYTGPMPDTLTTEFADPNEPDVCHTCGAPEGECDCDDEQSHEDAGCGCAECEDARRAAMVSENANQTTIIPPKMINNDSCPVCKYDKFACTCPVEPKPKETARDILGLKTELNDAIFKRVVQFLSDQTGVPEHTINPDSRMNSAQFMLNSLDGVELIMALEEEFGIEIPDEDAEKANNSNVEEIVNYIEQRLERDHAHTVTPPSDQNYYAIGEADGKMQRAIDRGTNLHNPKYRAGDEEGADSQPHAQYILGYVKGYGQ